MWSITDHDKHLPFYNSCSCSSITRLCIDTTVLQRHLRLYYPITHRTITQPVIMPKQHLLSKSFPNALHTLVDKTKTITCMTDICVCKHTNTESIHDKTKKYTKLPHEIKQQRHMVTSDNYTSSSATSVMPNTLHKKLQNSKPKIRNFYHPKGSSTGTFHNVHKLISYQ